MNDTDTWPNVCRLAFTCADGSDGLHLLHVRTGLHELCRPICRTICSGVAGPTAVGSNMRNGKIDSLCRKMCDLCNYQRPTQDEEIRVT